MVGSGWLNFTRVRLATNEEQLARARRSLTVGNWLVEREWHGSCRYWNEISSHHSEIEAEKAKIKLDRKIAKGIKK